MSTWPNKDKTTGSRCGPPKNVCSLKGNVGEHKFDPYTEQVGQQSSIRWWLRYSNLQEELNQVIPETASWGSARPPHLKLGRGIHVTRNSQHVSTSKLIQPENDLHHLVSTTRKQPSPVRFYASISCKPSSFDRYSPMDQSPWPRHHLLLPGQPFVWMPW